MSENLQARAGYVMRPDGQLVRGRVLGFTCLYALNKKITDPTSNAKFNKNTKINTEHLTSLALIKSQNASPKGLSSHLTDGRVPVALTHEQKVVIGQSKEFKNTVYSVDSITYSREKQRFEALGAQPKLEVRWEHYKNEVKHLRSPVHPVDAAVKLRKAKRNDWARHIAGASKRWSSGGDAVNAVTTITANSGAALVGPSKDGDSVKHTGMRCAFTAFSLAVLGANGAMWRSIIQALDDGEAAKLVGDFAVTQSVGWYWLMPIFHGVAFAGQLGAAALVDKTVDVKVQKVTEAEVSKNKTLEKVSDMINAVRHDPVARRVLIEGLNRRVSAKYRTNGVPKVWLKLETARTPAELQLAIAEFLADTEPGGESQISVFKREYQLLKVFKLAENNRTEGASDKCDESARMNFERKALKAHSPASRLVAKAVYRISGHGKIESVAKLARWIEKQSDISYMERRKTSLMTVEGRIKHRYHPQVARSQGGPLSKALFNLGFFVRDFGRNVILSLDTNLARVIRCTVQHLWENITGTHASRTMCHTFGMITGWLIIGVALTVLSAGLDAGLGAAGAVITSDGPGFGVGFASLTFAYWGCAMAGGAIWLLAMALARAGI